MSLVYSHLSRLYHTQLQLVILSRVQVLVRILHGNLLHSRGVGAVGRLRPRYSSLGKLKMSARSPLAPC